MKKPAVTIRVNDSESIAAMVDTGSDTTIVPRKLIGITKHDPVIRVEVLGKPRYAQKRKFRLTVGDRLEETIVGLVLTDPKDEFALLGTDFLQARRCRVSLRPGKHAIECRGGRVEMSSLPGGSPLAARRRRRRRR